MREFWIRDKMPTHKDTAMYCLKVWGLAMIVSFAYIYFDRFSNLDNSFYSFLKIFLILDGLESLLGLLATVFVLRYFSDDLIWIKILLTSFLVTIAGILSAISPSIETTFYMMMIIGVWYFDLSKSAVEIEKDYEDILDA